MFDDVVKYSLKCVYFYFFGSRSLQPRRRCWERSESWRKPGGNWLRSGSSSTSSCPPSYESTTTKTSKPPAAKSPSVHTSRGLWTGPQRLHTRRHWFLPNRWWPSPQWIHIAWKRPLASLNDYCLDLTTSWKPTACCPPRPLWPIGTRTLWTNGTQPSCSPWSYRVLLVSQTAALNPKRLRRRRDCPAIHLTHSRVSLQRHSESKKISARHSSVWMLAFVLQRGTLIIIIIIMMFPSWRVLTLWKVGCSLCVSRTIVYISISDSSFGGICLFVLK